VTLRCTITLLTDRELLAALTGLALAGEQCLLEARENRRPFPLLYSAGVKYIEEPEGEEEWLLPREVMRFGGGDCEDLAAAWRVPELWLMGELGARVYLRRVSSGLRHVMVRRANGVIEDPSVILGMPAPY